MPACASLVTSTTPVGSSGEGTLSPRSRRDRRTRTTRKSTVSASPRAMFRDLPAALGRHAGGHHQRPADHPVPHSHVQVRGVDEQVGEPGVIQRPGEELLDALVDVLADPRDRGAADPGLVAQGLDEVARPCGWRPPRSTRSRSRRIWALSTRLRGWSREGKNDPVRSLGMASSTSPAVVATVLRRLPLRRLVRCGVRS